MNILWIVNITLPEAEKLLTGNGSLKTTGGWLVGGAEALSDQPGINLYIASLYTRVDKLTRLEGKKIIYYLLPYGKGNDHINHDYEPLWREIRDAVHPDVVHLHGTEYTHGLAYIQACGASNVCVSIQGLAGAYYQYTHTGLSKTELLLAQTPFSLLRSGTFLDACFLKHMGKTEEEILRKVHHIIGRTSWDKAHTWAINPHAEYHYGGETLRKEFYRGQVWNYSECTPHTIFLSQARTAIKGLHMLLRAMPLVLRHFPDTIIRIAGDDVFRKDGWNDLLRLSDYGRIVRNLIRKYGLSNHIVFTGPLDGEGMCNEYLKCNVFVCPSSIENSPNSLGEAQVLGVPVIASYVGGVMDMMRGDEEHIYRFEEVEILAHKIVQLFERGDAVETETMRKSALLRHDPERNVSELVEVYEKIANSIVH